MSFHLLRPEWLLALLPVIALLVLGWRHSGGRGGGWEAWVDGHLLRHLRVVRGGRQRRWPLLGLALLWAGLVVALAGPSWSRLPEIDYRLQREPLVIVLDLSRSMNRTDLAPSRLEVAKQAVRELLRQWTVGEVGLVVFAATAHRVLPLTEEARIVGDLLDSLDPEMMPAPHSRPVAGLRLGHALARASGERGGDILMVTDGGDARLAAAAREVREAGVRVSVLAVAPSSGSPRDRAILAQVAQQGGGVLLTYPVATAQWRDFIRKGAKARQSDDPSDSPPARQWRDQGGWLVALLLPFLTLLFRRGWLLSLVLVAGISPAPAKAWEWRDLWLRPDQQAMQAWQRGDYEAAAQLFRDPLWKGMARYRLGDYAGALAQFAAVDSSIGHYNRGVTLMRLGAWEEARWAFEAALRLEPGNLDAQFNRQLLDWYLERRGASRADTTASRNRRFVSADSAEKSTAIRHQEAPMRSTGPEREAPGAAEIRDQALPKGKLGGAAMLLEQARSHEGPESDTAGEARSSGAQTGSEAPGSRSRQATGSAAAGKESLGERSEGGSPAKPTGAETGHPGERESTGGTGDQQVAAGATAQRRAGLEPADSDAMEPSAGPGRSPGHGGLASGQAERQQALEQWLAGLSSDARELLQREFRRNYERARPDLEGVEPW